MRDGRNNVSFVTLDLTPPGRGSAVQSEKLIQIRLCGGQIEEGASIDDVTTIVAGIAIIIGNGNVFYIN